MQSDDTNERLSRITTMWTMLRRAHAGSSDTARSARQELMQRYCGAVYRYLLSAVRDPHAAEDLTQEFALRFIRGRFEGADPERGRFRDYVKRSLFNLVGDYRKQQRKEPRALAPELAEPAVLPQEEAELDRAFINSWRQELLARAWQAIAKAEQETGQPYHAVLRLRIQRPDLRSPQLAEELSAALGKRLTAAGVRQLLHRSREKFAAALVEETRRSLGPATPEQLDEELAELNLLKYCKNAL